MISLQEKLFYLGYKQNGYDLSLFYKFVDASYILCFHLDILNNIVYKSFIYSYKFEIDLEIIEKLSNQLRNDLDFLKYGN